MFYENAKNLMEKLEFPTDSISELLLTLKKLLEKSEFVEIVNNYNLEDFDFSKSLEDTKKITYKQVEEESTDKKPVYYNTCVADSAWAVCFISHGFSSE